MWCSVVFFIICVGSRLVSRVLSSIAEVASNVWKGILFCHEVGQLKYLVTRTMWAQHFLQREGIEVRRTCRGLNSADCIASHHSSTDVNRGIVRMGGKWPGVEVATLIV